MLIKFVKTTSSSTFVEQADLSQFNQCCSCPKQEEHDESTWNLGPSNSLGLSHISLILHRCVNPINMLKLFYSQSTLSKLLS